MCRPPPIHYPVPGLISKDSLVLVRSVFVSESFKNKNKNHWRFQDDGSLSLFHKLSTQTSQEAPPPLFFHPLWKTIQTLVLCSRDRWDWLSDILPRSTLHISATTGILAMLIPSVNARVIVTKTKIVRENLFVSTAMRVNITSRSRAVSAARGGRQQNGLLRAPLIS